MRQWHCYVEGQQYGPVSEDVVVKWIREHRLGPADHIWAEGLESWVTVADVPELAPVAAATLDMAEPGMAVRPASPPGKNMAVGGMIAGIVSLVAGVCVFPCFMPIAALVGVILSATALKQMNSAGSTDGRGMALAGAITSAIGLALTGIGVAVWALLLAVP